MFFLSALRVLQKLEITRVSRTLEERVSGSGRAAVVPHPGWKPGRLGTCLHNAVQPRPGRSRRWPRIRASRCAPGRWPSLPRELY